MIMITTEPMVIIKPRFANRVFNQDDDGVAVGEVVEEEVSTITSILNSPSNNDAVSNILIEYNERNPEFLE